MKGIHTSRFQDDELAAAVASMVDLARDFTPEDSAFVDQQATRETRETIARVCALIEQGGDALGDRRSLVDAIRGTLKYPAHWVAPLMSAVEAKAPGLMLQLISETAVGDRADFTRRINILEWMLPTERLQSLSVALNEYRRTHPVFLV